MKCRLVVLRLLPPELEHYRVALDLPTAKAALLALGRALLAGLSSGGPASFQVRVRATPTPVLGLFGEFDSDQVAMLRVQGEALRHACRTLRYVGQAQAQLDCARLGQRLVAQFGRRELAALQFAVVPRGGLFVLATLAYVLGLDRRQCEPDDHSDAPLVVVDDCCLTGARCAEAIERWPGRRLIFAHLYSHPELRAAVAAEPAVEACVAAHDLTDLGPELLGERYEAWRQQWRQQLEGRRFWLGVPEALAFHWSEPDRSVHLSAARPMERAWKVVPPELCLETRCGIGPGHELEVSAQPAGAGPIEVSDTALYLRREDTLLLGDLESGECLELGGSAPVLWEGLLESGTVEGGARAMAAAYDISWEVALQDAEELSRRLVERGFLVQRELVDPEA
jgi:hypothetical protein